MATHSSTLAWRIPWTEEPGRLQSMELLGVGHDWVTSLSLSCIGEGNGNPLQYSCLENPRDGGAWGAAVYGVAQSWTRLKRLSSSSSSVLIGLPRWCSGKESTCQCRKHKRCRLNPWVGKICWRRKCNPLHYSCLENSMDRGAWQATVHGVTESETWLSMNVGILCYVLSVPTLLTVLFMTICWILTKKFYALIDINMWLLFFILLMWCIVDFMDIGSYLHAWDRSYLIMVYCSFNMSLNSIC